MEEQGQKRAPGQNLALISAVGLPTIGETAVLATHFGGPGLITGLAAGVVAYLVADDVIKTRQTHVSSTPQEKKPAASDQLSSIAHRLLVGKSAREQVEQPCVTQKAEQQEVTQAIAPVLAPMEALQVARKPNPMHVEDDAFDFTAEDTLIAPTFAPTGAFFFSEVLKTFTPSLEKIYLGTLPNGQLVFTEARKLCHTALAGATRGGKDHVIRQLMSQLCYAGAKVYLLDPNYTRYDLESIDPYGRSCPEDWTPFDKWLVNDPREMTRRDRKYKAIEHYLALAFDMVEDRLEARAEGVKLGAPQFLFVNEFAAIADEVPNAKMFLKKILREGAKVGVFLVSAAQDYHVSTLFKEIGGGVRKCYRTAFDVGSDTTTQNALGLLPLKQLGKGNGSIRYDDLLSAIRLPYVDNEALYALLGPSTYKPSNKRRQDDEDELLSSLVRGSNAVEHDEEPETETLPVQRRHIPTSAYDLHRQRLESRKRPVYVTREREEERKTKEPKTNPMQVSPNEIEISAKDAYVMWSNGHSSVRELAKVMGVTIYQATKLYNAMVDEGLIERKAKVTIAKSE